MFTYTNTWCQFTPYSHLIQYRPLIGWYWSQDLTTNRQIYAVRINRCHVDLLNLSVTSINTQLLLYISNTECCDRGNIDTLLWRFHVVKTSIKTRVGDFCFGAWICSSFYGILNPEKPRLFGRDVKPLMPVACLDRATSLQPEWYTLAYRERYA